MADDVVRGSVVSHEVVFHHVDVVAVKIKLFITFLFIKYQSVCRCADLIYDDFE